jgi:hypothetical protein
VAEQMIIEANRSVLMAGLEPGRFTPLPNGGVVYLSSISPDGTQLGKVFLQRQKDDRLEVVSANGGRMFFEGTRQRFRSWMMATRWKARWPGAGLPAGDLRPQRCGPARRCADPHRG